MTRPTLSGPLSHDLKAARVNAGHSIRSLGRELELSQDAIARAERGESIDPATAHKIATFHGLKVTDVWTLNTAEPVA